MKRQTTLVEIAPLAVPLDPAYIIIPTSPPISKLAPQGIAQKGIPLSLQPELVGAVGTLTWSATGLPAGVSIDPTTGALTGTPTTQAYSQATISVFDAGTGDTTDTVFGFNVGGAFAITGALREATAQSAYSGNLLAVGATGVVTWGAVGLPAGLSIAPSTGIISGTYATSTGGAFVVTLTASDAGTGTSVAVVVPLVINRSITAVSVDGSQSVVPKLLAGAPFSMVLRAIGGIGGNIAGTAPFLFETTGLPAGLSANSATGIVSGETSPDVVGDFALTLTVTDTWGNTATTNKTLTVVNGTRALAAGRFAVGASDGSGEAVGLDYFAAYFGDGSDGNVTISSGVTALGRHMYYDTLTINGTGKLNANGFDIYCKTLLDLSAAGANAIYSGSSAVAFPNVVQRNPGPFGSLGGAAVTGSITTGNPGSVGDPVFIGKAKSGTSGSGGAGSNAAGNGELATTPGVTSNPQKNLLSMDVEHAASGVWLFTSNTAVPYGGGCGGPSGGSGGGSGAAAGGASGAGGGGGGRIRVFARSISRGVGTSAAAISAGGFRGANGSNGPAANRGAGGGGGGGGGGYVRLVFLELIGSSVAGLVGASGGTGGNGGASGGLGSSPGSGGGGGDGGAVLVQDLLASSYVVYLGGAGSPASGATGGAGAAFTVSL